MREDLVQITRPLCLTLSRYSASDGAQQLSWSRLRGIRLCKSSRSRGAIAHASSPQTPFPSCSRATSPWGRSVVSRRDGASAVERTCAKAGLLRRSLLHMLFQPRRALHRRRHAACHCYQAGVCVLCNGSLALRLLHKNVPGIGWQLSKAASAAKCCSFKVGFSQIVDLGEKLHRAVIRLISWATSVHFRPSWYRSM